MYDYIKMQFQKCLDTFRGELLLETYLVLKQLAFRISSIFHFVSCVWIHAVYPTCYSFLLFFASLSFFYPSFPVHLWKSDVAVEAFLGCCRILQGNVNIPLSLLSSALNYTKVPLRQVSSPCHHLGNSSYSYIAKVYVE